MFGAFHFQRPLWLAAIPLALWLVAALLRRGDPRRAWRGIMDEHLLKALLIRGRTRSRWGPAHVLGLVWVLAALALAGPSWRPEPSPFAQDEAALVIVMEVTQSMLATDVQPSRLERAAQKVGDLLALRPDAEAALVAYAGTAHRVLPLTADHEALSVFARSLDPEVMPRAGDAAAQAIALANAELQRTGRAGSLVLLSDGVAPDQVDTIRRAGSVPVHVLGLGRPPSDSASLQRIADATGGSVVVVTGDASDVDRLAGSIDHSIGRSSGELAGTVFSDEGYWLVPLVTLLILFWSRRGWSLGPGGGAP